MHRVPIALLKILEAHKYDLGMGFQKQLPTLQFFNRHVSIYAHQII